ncbi:Hypothetical protein PHPALM_951 [Phytophthora palmivora]|uniref:PiggyBac transposable element-derived protein domain-containing protein n=1 Tax=Phytophthora palmivora TaxID=4796 RepID=A0A2P4YTJ1_9STRA|nr:Hypothetical protein PHPALM_951 [Phytophthora palmivora]
MVTMRTEPMLHPISDDDINLSADAIDVGNGSEDQSSSDSGPETGKRNWQSMQLMTFTKGPELMNPTDITHAACSNNGRGKRRRMLRAQQKDPSICVQTLENIAAKLWCHKYFRPHEFCHLIGLLITRTFCPMRDGATKPWHPTKTEPFLVAPGARSHASFNNNESPNALHNKAGKFAPFYRQSRQRFPEDAVLVKVFPSMRE